eukprot:11166032-Alexandrium_andersonii.AAC.1
MSASLVGSEMCIRDSSLYSICRPRMASWTRSTWTAALDPRAMLRPPAVSYTHLTLPTICSV